MMNTTKHLPPCRMAPAGVSAPTLVLSTLLALAAGAEPASAAEPAKAAPAKVAEPAPAKAVAPKAAAPVRSLRVLVNHLGYEVHGSKKLVVESEGGAVASTFAVLDAAGKPALEGPLGKPQKVDNWKRWTFYAADFSALDKPGTYRVRVRGPNKVELVSEPFTIGRRVLCETTLNDLASYLKSQRCSGVYDKTDRNLYFVGDARPPVDVHGGWYDASGDVSKYLSHLSYANYLNPQQTPMVVWDLLEAADLIRPIPNTRLKSLVPVLEEEALYGADFLVRMQDPAGYFYLTVFDVWSHEAKRRRISAYKTQKGILTPEYQAAFREGGGMAVAALARVSTMKQTGDYPPAKYLATAEKGFAHLQAKSLDYADDHQDNIIDDYTALMAATELYRATQKPAYLTAARARSESLRKRLKSDGAAGGHWVADLKTGRPFFHAADAGLPVMALLRYRATEPDAALAQAALAAIETSLGYELALTREVPNPFGYARQLVKDLDGGTRTAFFFPHKNESGYWWQGENARLGSLASAALIAARELAPRRRELVGYATDQLDWIFGLNPYDMSMLQGRGRNNPDYLPENPNVPGGVCNGITSGFEDEHDIAFMPPGAGQDIEQNWRWAEQWLPHAGWLALALAAQAALLEPAGP
jgi:hypothetical protein